MKRSLGAWAVVGIVILCGWAKPAYSQAGTSAAQLNGTVKDASGGSVAKASLTLREVSTNRTYTAVSNDNGLYVIPNLPSGTYELTAEATGFAKSTHTGIVLTVGQVATIDVNVSVAQTAEKVVVTTETPPVEPYADRSQPSDQHQPDSVAADQWTTLHGFCTSDARGHHGAHQLAVHHHGSGGHADLVWRNAGFKQPGNSRWRGHCQHGDWLAAEHTVSRSGERVSSGQQRVRSGAGPSYGWNRKHHHEIRHE